MSTDFSDFSNFSSNFDRKNKSKTCDCNVCKIKRTFDDCKEPTKLKNTTIRPKVVIDDISPIGSRSDKRSDSDSESESESDTFSNIRSQNREKIDFDAIKKESNIRKPVKLEDKDEKYNFPGFPEMCDDSNFKASDIGSNFYNNKISNSTFDEFDSFGKDDKFPKVNKNKKF